MLLCKPEVCTGCGACRAVCPVDAITMQQDAEGFLAPVINDACIQCGACTRTCPALAETPLHCGNAAPDAYLVKALDDDILLNSASGGAFTLLAQEMLKRGGAVYGTRWDEKVSAEIAGAETFKQVLPMRGSKYVQSDSKLRFREIKRRLQNGQHVLFSGVPCQIAGLYRYLGKPYDHLITVGLVCHGGGSPGVFARYLEYMEKLYGSKVVSLCQTDKSQGWNVLIPRNTLLRLQNGQEVKKTAQTDAYLSAYMRGLIYRKACYQCPYAALPRVEDITIGDFFGIGCIYPCKQDLTNGVSQVLLNTKKGSEYFQTISKTADAVFSQRTLEECTAFNHNIVRPTSMSPQRQAFFEDYRHSSFEALNGKYLINNPAYRRQLFVRNAAKKLLGHRNIARGMYVVGKIKKLLNR